MDDLSLLLTLAERHPYLAVAAVVACVLCAAVVALAQVYPGEDWCRAHPRLFAVLRLCRAVAPWLIKAADRLREARSTPLAQAAIARAFDKAAPTPTPTPVDRPTEPPSDPPDTDPTPPPSLGGGGRRTLARHHTSVSLDATAAPARVLGGVAILSTPEPLMATNFRLSTTLKNAALDAAFGSAQNAGLVRIYDGTQPAGPGTAVTSQTLLATLTLNATAWAAASSGSKAANAITSGVAVATGTASWFRILDSTGVTAYADGSVGTSSADMILPTTSIVSGVTVSCSSLVVSVPVSA